MLERERLSDDGKIFLYRAKTGVAVNVPVPPDVAESLHALPSENARYFFWSGNGDPQTAEGRGGCRARGTGPAAGDVPGRTQ